MLRKLSKHRNGIFLNLGKIVKYYGYVIVEEAVETDDHIFLKLRKVK